MNFAN